MPNYLREWDNLGLIVVGRPVTTEFGSSHHIKEIAALVDELGIEHGLALELVYAGTTAGWPDDFKRTPSVIGIVTHVDRDHDESERTDPLPREALAFREIPDAVWSKLAEYDVGVTGETGTHLAIVGWTWTQILDAHGEPIAAVSAEDFGYIRIDDDERVMKGDGPLSMQTSYC